MKKNDFVNMWLGLMLRRMKKRVGFVNLVSAEGHIRKHVFSDDVDDIVSNINSAEHLVRMILLWAWDCVTSCDSNFDQAWAELGEYAKRLMLKHGEEFCRAYEKDDSKSGRAIQQPNTDKR